MFSESKVKKEDYKRVKGKVNPSDLASVSPLVLGGAILNQQYTDEPESIPLEDIIRYAFSHGINAIDTSPYYGPSEVLYGRALANLKDEFPRDTYLICTKVGRIGAEEFNYSRDFVRFSVHRSCKRLGTTYLDLVYLHDVEFVPFPDILEALKELRILKSEGIIKNLGISGYPIDFITWLAEHCSTKEDDIGSLDAVLSYCNLNLQNNKLLNFRERLLRNAKLKMVCNASILSMSLLRSQETRQFHPCSHELRECASRAAKYCQDENTDLADLATRYAISEWMGKGPVVLGVSSMEELKLALDNYEIVKSNDNKLSSKDRELVNFIQKNIFKEHFNEKWSSGIPHPEMIESPQKKSDKF
ncbi:AHL_G0041070.mRNA.1.CDS.1 [Saccharomyces cerevisiae]|uniref:D-arabinose 1-dehydrogenase (NAD(P)(+)) ARA2 n=1 Tax=Saccharomyces paradoxus TaxID=27291 RepID=A0A8B8UX61_SACPA|nr:Ara2 [Saccharomyces paradoxus]QHS75320.1 Ara2 [Saccharomyces paradoxus]CAI4895277.1 AHL_G0041070.mRNA.1.CDS.1 [Saccharomyces cerevisiae]CAI6837701.1 AHL_G0041070.mRNA.1.CDS.1 [Saccharomyces cerevisiae]